MLALAQENERMAFPLRSLYNGQSVKTGEEDCTAFLAKLDFKIDCGIQYLLKIFADAVKPLRKQHNPEEDDYELAIESNFLIVNKTKDSLHGNISDLLLLYYRASPSKAETSVNEKILCSLLSEIKNQFLQAMLPEYLRNNQEYSHADHDLYHEWSIAEEMKMQRQLNFEQPLEAVPAILLASELTNRVLRIWGTALQRRLELSISMRVNKAIDIMVPDMLLNQRDPMWMSPGFDVRAAFFTLRKDLIDVALEHPFFTQENIQMLLGDITSLIARERCNVPLQFKIMSTILEKTREESINAVKKQKPWGATRRSEKQKDLLSKVMTATTGFGTTTVECGRQSPPVVYEWEQDDMLSEAVRRLPQFKPVVVDLLVELSRSSRCFIQELKFLTEPDALLIFSNYLDLFSDTVAGGEKLINDVISEFKEHTHRDCMCLSQILVSGPECPAHLRQKFTLEDERFFAYCDRKHEDLQCAKLCAATEKWLKQKLDSVIQIESNRSHDFVRLRIGDKDIAHVPSFAILKNQLGENGLIWDKYQLRPNVHRASLPLDSYNGSNSCKVLFECQQNSDIHVIILVKGHKASRYTYGTFTKEEDLQHFADNLVKLKALQVRPWNAKTNEEVCPDRNIYAVLAKIFHDKLTRFCVQRNQPLPISAVQKVRDGMLNAMRMDITPCPNCETPMQRCSMQMSRGDEAATYYWKCELCKISLDNKKKRM